MSRWHAERERLNHESFQHYFFDLIAQSSHVSALDSLPVSNQLPRQLFQVLRSWEGLSNSFRALFERANPEAVLSCHIFLALLRRDDSRSREIISNARLAYAPIIEARLAPARALLRDIDRLVLWIQTITAGGPEVIPSDAHIGTTLVTVCREFSESVSALRSVGHIPDEEDALYE